MGRKRIDSEYKFLTGDEKRDREKLKELLRENQINQSDVARHLNVSRQLVSAVINRKYNIRRVLDFFKELETTN